MANRAEDEDYWNDSETKTRAKAFNFEEDEFGSQLCGVSKSGTARLSQQVRAGIGGDSSNYNEDSLSGYGANNAAGPRKQSRPLLTLISERSLNKILEAGKQQPWEARGSLPPSEELRLLRRLVEERWTPPDVAVTVRNIFLGHPYTLELYRSMESKTALLDEAIRLGDGNAILIVVLYLVKTLNKSLVYKLLLTRPVAVSQYVHYLTTRLQIHELTDLLEMLGRRRDAAMKQFQVAVKGSGNAERRLAKLRNVYVNHFSTLESRDRPLVENYVKLLEWQLAAARLSPTLDSGVLNESVLGSLAHSCRHHWSDARGSAMAPTTLSQQHGVNERQYQWTAVTVRASMQAWDDIEALFITKSWMGGRKVRAAVPMERVVVQLHAQGAPPTVLAKYLEMIDNPQRRAALAKKLQCHKTVIDVMVSQRDRQAVIGYKANLHPQSEDYFYAENALRVSSLAMWSCTSAPTAPPPTPTPHVRRASSLPNITSSTSCVAIDLALCHSEILLVTPSMQEWAALAETRLLLHSVVKKLVQLQERREVKNI